MNRFSVRSVILLFTGWGIFFQFLPAQHPLKDLTDNGYDMINPLIIGKWITVANNYNYGLIDTTGKEIFPCEYDQMYINLPLVAGQKNRVWHFYRLNGDSFEEISNPYPVMEMVTPLEKGYWNFSMRGPEASTFDDILLDSNLKIILHSTEYRFISGFSEGYCVAMNTNRDMGLLDSEGKWVLKPQYLFVNPIKNGGALICENNNPGYIPIYHMLNSSLQPMFELKGEYEFESPSDIIPAIDPANQKLGYANNKGKMVIPGKFDEAGAFHEGLAPVNFNGKYGYINSQGAFVIEPKLAEYPGDFHEGIASFKVDSRLGYMDRSGKEIIPPQYYEGSDFNGGYAVVKDDSEQFLLVDAKGVTSNLGEEAYLCKGGVFIVMKTENGKFSLLKPFTD